MNPTAIGIGVQKCATSWMHSVLGAHPQIGVSKPKEVDFFSYYFDRGYSWYERHFDHLQSFDARCDTSPSYFYDPRAAVRAREYRSDLKVIALLRDPVARAYSNHLHEIIKGHIEPLDFERGLQNNPAYLEQGLYSTHLKRWLEVFGTDQVLVMLAEDVHADPLRCASQVYSFLGVDAEFVSALVSERRNVSDVARYPGLRRALRGCGDIMRHAGLEEQLVQFKAVKPVAGLLKSNSVDLRDQIAPMKDSTRLELAEFFKAEVRELADLLGRRSLPWSTWDDSSPDMALTSVAS